MGRWAAARVGELVVVVWLALVALPGQGNQMAAPLRGEGSG